MDCLDLGWGSFALERREGKWSGRVYGDREG